MSSWRHQVLVDSAMKSRLSATRTSLRTSVWQETLVHYEASERSCSQSSRSQCDVCTKFRHSCKLQSHLFKVAKWTSQDLLCTNLPWAYTFTDPFAFDLKRGLQNCKHLVKCQAWDFIVSNSVVDLQQKVDCRKCKVEVIYKSLSVNRLATLWCKALTSPRCASRAYAHQAHIASWLLFESHRQYRDV